MNKNDLSFVARSCLFTKACAAKLDKRQRVRKSYLMPTSDVRKHLAEMILEEALETVNALGFQISSLMQDKRDGLVRVVPRMVDKSFSLEDIIDGCCDTIYVATGALVACGVPDIPHLREVCRANDRKFPDGQAIINPDTGKYLKPIGWESPNHEAVKSLFKKETDMIELSKALFAQGNSNASDDEGRLQPVSQRDLSALRDGGARHPGGYEAPGTNNRTDEEESQEVERETSDQD